MTADLCSEALQTLLPHAALAGLKFVDTLLVGGQLLQSEAGIDAMKQLDARAGRTGNLYSSPIWAIR